MSADTVNGLFEFGAALMILNHCRVLFAQKMVRGVSVLSTTFFFSWGMWNIYYYPHIDQLMSFVGGLFVVAANGLWVALMLHYRRGGDVANPAI